MHELWAFEASAPAGTTRAGPLTPTPPDSSESSVKNPELAADFSVYVRFNAGQKVPQAADFPGPLNTKSSRPVTHRLMGITSELISS